MCVLVSVSKFVCVCVCAHNTLGGSAWDAGGAVGLRHRVQHEGQLRTKQSINRYIGCVRGLETLRLEVVADVEKAAAAAAAASEALARATREMTLSSTDDDADLAFALSPKSVSAAMRGTPSSAVSRKGASGGGAISGSASTPGSTAQPVGAGTGNA